MPAPPQPRPTPTTALGLARCLDCGRALAGRAGCPGCPRVYREAGGILDAIGPLAGTNRVAAAFYESPAWPRFKFWEQVFLAAQGPGCAAARRQVLRFVPARAGARVLEVGVGDGENVPLLAPGCEVYGVDIARGRLAACAARFPATAGRLAWAEGERLPFEDAAFDAVFTVGGVNYFRDPAAALREMRRVARPGAPLVAADEDPELYRFGIGHLLGLDAVDRLWLRMTGLADDFVRMVLETPPRVEAAARAAWPGHRRVPVWNRLGYCLVDTR